MRAISASSVNNRILVVEDEADVVHLVGPNFSPAGYHILVAEEGATAITLARGVAQAPISILLLRARTDDVDRILGLELGAGYWLDEA